MTARRDPLQALRTLRARWRAFWFRLVVRALAREAAIGPDLRLYGSVVLTHVRGAKLRIGRHVMLGQGWLSVLPGAELEIGDKVSLNQCFTLLCATKVRIGSDTRIGELVSIRDQDHRFDDPDSLIHEQGFASAPIEIGANCWIGRGAAILRGVTIGDGAVIGANAVVTKDVPASEVWGGVPARRIRAREG